MNEKIKGIIYTFPMQLVFLHLKRNKLLLSFWLLIVLFMTGNVGGSYGVGMLFLDPEYMGKVNFWSFYFIGLTFGAFAVVWNITSYILHSYRFPFLASLNRPFTKFCLNNFVIPVTFIIFYIASVIRFQAYNEYAEENSIILYCLGFFVGLFTSILLTALYFQITNKDIDTFLKTKKSPPPTEPDKSLPSTIIVNEEEESNEQLMSPHAVRSSKLFITPKTIKTIKERRDRTYERTAMSNKSPWKVDFYLSERLKWRLVRDVTHYDSKLLIEVFRQNHANALVIQVVSLMVLVVLGSMIDRPSFLIPAGASILILFAILESISGALRYWLGTWSFSVLLGLLLFINHVSTFRSITYQNKAFGLNYEHKSEYNHNILMEQSEKYYQEDMDSTLLILNNWHKKVTKGNSEAKPKMVLVCVSGGGLRSAVWTMNVIQQGNKVCDGKLFDHTMMMTGASGGMLGVAYMRELYLKEQLGRDVNVNEREHINDLSKDLLNPMAFTLVVNDLFLPWQYTTIGGYRYRKDRGYIFEKHLMENTYGVFDRPLRDYRVLEQKATIPMLLMTPVIVNDARYLFISPQGVSYMTRPPAGFQNKNLVQVDGVDFGRFFEKQNSYNLRYSTALRMSATFPYLLPNVILPTSPPLEVMDAGLRDNYGLAAASRFAQTFSEWIKENTSGVVILQIRDTEKIDDLDPHPPSMMETMINPLGIAGKWGRLQDYEQDNNLSYLNSLLGDDMLDIVRFTYTAPPEKRAIMNMHISTRDKNLVIKNIKHPKNKAALEKLRKLIVR